LDRETGLAIVWRASRSAMI